MSSFADVFFLCPLAVLHSLRYISEAIFFGEVTPGALIKRLLKGCEFRKQGRTRGPRGDVTCSLICLAHALIGISKSQAHINYVRLREKQP